MNKAYVFENSTSKRIYVSLEPWGEDYHLEPGDIFELHYHDQVSGYFHSKLSDEYLEVFVEGNLKYPDKITVNEIAAECGHGRVD
ncbi:MAG: hypothetical protein ACKVH8_21335 [Pirellulales bacterium]|jgi:hypothetical protein